MARFVNRLNKKAIKEYVEPILEQWADWALAEGLHKGYASGVSWLGLGMRTDSGPSILLAYDDDRMIEINSLVNQLPDVIKDAVKTEWLYPGTREMKAGWTGVTPSTYDGRLLMGYYHLIAWGL